MLYARAQSSGFFNHSDWLDSSGAAVGLNQCNGHLLSVHIGLISPTELRFIPPCEPRCHKDAVLHIAPLSGRRLLQILPSAIWSEPNRTSRSLCPPPWLHSQHCCQSVPPARQRFGSEQTDGSTSLSCPLSPLPSCTFLIWLCPQRWTVPRPSVRGWPKGLLTSRYMLCVHKEALP